MERGGIPSGLVRYMCRKGSRGDHEALGWTRVSEAAGKSRSAVSRMVEEFEFARVPMLLFNTCCFCTLSIQNGRFHRILMNFAYRWTTLGLDHLIIVACLNQGVIIITHLAYFQGIILYDRKLSSDIGPNPPHQPPRYPHIARGRKTRKAKFMFDLDHKEVI
jgi:RNase P/RNase MRP subunit p30